MPRNFSFRFPDELATKVDEESARKQITASDVIRQAVEDYFQRDRQRQNFETMLYEVIRTRAVLLRCFDMAGTELSEELLEEAGKDATEYLEQRRKRS